MKKEYNIYNFPVSYIPKIIDDKETLRNDCVEFALIYACHNDRATAGDLDKMAARYHVNLYDKKKVCNRARALIDKHRNQPEPLTYLTHKQLWRFINHPYDEVDLMALALLMALRSIGRRDRQVKTTMDMIKARMSGEKVPGCHVIVHKDVERWTTRRKFQSLKRYLQSKGLVRFTDGHSRGVSFNLDPI